MFMSAIWHYYVYVDYMVLYLCRYIALLCSCQLYGIIMFMSTIGHYYVYID